MRQLLVVLLGLGAAACVKSELALPDDPLSQAATCSVEAGRRTAMAAPRYRPRQSDSAGVAPGQLHRCEALLCPVEGLRTRYRLRGVPRWALAAST